jgi:hypothetical protein
LISYFSGEILVSTNTSIWLAISAIAPLGCACLGVLIANKSMSSPFSFKPLDSIIAFALLIIIEILQTSY